GLAQLLPFRPQLMEALRHQGHRPAGDPYRQSRKLGAMLAKRPVAGAIQRLPEQIEELDPAVGEGLAEADGVPDQGRRVHVTELPRLIAQAALQLDPWQQGWD